MAMNPADGDRCVSRLARSFAKLIPHRTRVECLYCSEKKLPKYFKKLVAHGCRAHLQAVCKACLRASLNVQLDNRPLLEVGCPSCRLPWSGKAVRSLLDSKSKKRFQELDLIAKQQTLIPCDLPEEATLDQMLERGTRFCPWCRFPFIKEGGCDAMLCGRCDKVFNISYALVLEDDKGRQAAPVPEEFDDDLFLRRFDEG